MAATSHHQLLYTNRGKTYWENNTQLAHNPRATDWSCAYPSSFESFTTAIRTLKVSLRPVLPHTSDRWSTLLAKPLPSRGPSSSGLIHMLVAGVQKGKNRSSRPLEEKSSEVPQHNFHHVLSIRASHKASRDARWQRIHSTFCWDGRQCRIAQ